MVDMPTENWGAVGRDLLRDELARQRCALEDAFGGAESALDTTRSTESLDADDVRALRRSLNRARYAVEEHAARVTPGVEPYGEPVPDLPYGVYRTIAEQ
ncbi:hypothetical protein GCM10009021_31920 [Halarchaeum nitratireducens]|uniref:Uncharacterized protein n=2 Tax=Halarchaeum nitratireducens TaxID=489913 RepID=A0A830GFL5_9EURY|nr:hypothetical protein GCM10009021_31920 [Halarchaeum nitratireducens]